MVNHPNRRNIYSITATVRRGSSQKTIEWEYEGRGSGTLAWSAWRKMRETNATMDTSEPFVTAGLFRNGRPIEQIGNVVQMPR